MRMLRLDQQWPEPLVFKESFTTFYTNLLLVLHCWWFLIPLHVSMQIEAITEHHPNFKPNSPNFLHTQERFVQIVAIVTFCGGFIMIFFFFLWNVTMLYLFVCHTWPFIWPCIYNNLSNEIINKIGILNLEILDISSRFAAKVLRIVVCTFFSSHRNH